MPGRLLSADFVGVAVLARERRLLRTLAGIRFANILDFMLMMPLGPLLMRALDIGAHEFGILVSAYSLTAGGAGLLAAGFIDRHERKRLLQVLLALFAAAALACALASGFWALLLARALAGACAGLLGTLVQTVVGDLIPLARRGQASGVLMTAFSLSTIAGVPLSLALAHSFGWRAPFFLVAFLATALLAPGARLLPEMRRHLVGAAEARHAGATLAAVLRDANHLRALWFIVLAVFSGYLVIPYLALYATANIGLREADIPLLYLVGGIATFLAAPRIGHLADRCGTIRGYRLLAGLSLLPLLIQTHLPPVPLWLMIVCSTLFFVLVQGRMVPAMAILTAAARPSLRGGFLSLCGAAQNLALGAAAWLGGALIDNTGGRIDGYGLAGLLAVAATLAAMFQVGRIRLRDTADRHGTPGGGSTV